MSTYSDRTRAIDRKQNNHLVIIVALLAMALATGCSVSLVDQAPEVLRYCRIADRSGATGGIDDAGQSAGPGTNAAADGCAGGADRVCDDEEIADAVARGDVVNCTP